MTNPTCDWVYDPAGGPGGRWFGGRNSRYRGGQTGTLRGAIGRLGSAHPTSATRNKPLNIIINPKKQKNGKNQKRTDRRS